jgi:NitT/TauT family transport system substrate-binding protein
MRPTLVRSFLPTTILALLAAVPLASHAAAPAPTAVVLAVDGITMVRNLPVLAAERLGYFKDEGLSVTLKETAVTPEIDAQLTDGRITAMVAYYHHTIVAQVEENLPVVAVATLAVTPGYKVLVAPQVAGQVKTIADLKGRRIISGGPHSAKTTSANWILLHAGFGPKDYTRLGTGDKAQIAAQLKNGEADAVIAPEPDAGNYVAKGVAVPFLDLYSLAGTRQAVGSAFPTTVVYMSSRYIESNPQVAQRLVNAFVRTLKYLGSHDVEEIARLVPEMATGANQSPGVLREGVKMFANDGRTPVEAALAEAEVVAVQFPEYRRVKVAETFTNRFVEAALAGAKWTR